MRKNTLILFLLAVSVLALTGCAAYAADGKQNTPAENVLFANQPPTPSIVEAASPLSREEAIAAALTHAGLEENQVTRLEAELDKEHGNNEYEIEFSHGNWEYEYEINAETGAVITWEREYDKFD